MTKEQEVFLDETDNGDGTSSYNLRFDPPIDAKSPIGKEVMKLVRQCITNQMDLLEEYEHGK